MLVLRRVVLRVCLSVPPTSQQTLLMTHTESWCHTARAFSPENTVSTKTARLVRFAFFSTLNPHENNLEAKNQNNKTMWTESDFSSTPSKWTVLSSTGIVDDALLLHNTAEYFSPLSSMIIECQHVNAKQCGPADAVSIWGTTSGDWRNQRLRGDWALRVYLNHPSINTIDTET